MSPYFLVSRAQDFVKKRRLYPLDKEKFLRVDPKIIQKYEKLVQQYLGNSFYPSKLKAA